jgi:hypothetical protein
MVRVSREADNIWAEFPGHSVLLFYDFGNIGCLGFPGVKFDARYNTGDGTPQVPTISTSMNN